MHTWLSIQFSKLCIVDLTAMRILVLSDLHNEFTVFEPAKAEVDVIVLAGDIDTGDKGILWARQNWPNSRIVYVVGNHEYYGHDYAETLAWLRQTAMAQDVHLLEDNEVVIEIGRAHV